jgi:UDP-N-acetylmuramyl tripeptide synthase
MTNTLLLIAGKFLSRCIKLFGLGNGSTWPGHTALYFNKRFISEIVSRSSMKIILIAGTNGKTTTAKMIRKALETKGNKVLHNESGANLVNGIASALIVHSRWNGKIEHDFGIFEIDENTLPQILREISPDYLILLNLFRDQLDRYGELDAIGKSWKKSIGELNDQCTLIANADDPRIACMATNLRSKRKFFGLENIGLKNKLQHSADSVFCPQCGFKLIFSYLSFSHLGSWKCKNCGAKRPTIDLKSLNRYPLMGIYNKYNSLAAVLTLKCLGLDEKFIDEAFSNFRPAFGRQEMLDIDGKKVQIFLSKNPTSFNESYETIKNMGAKKILFVLNDRIPDGRDVSWIWDFDLSELNKLNKILISGDRAFDMALRIKYAESMDFFTKKVEIFDKLEVAIRAGINSLNKDEVLYVLPTYSAMLEVRKILTGKKIL